jgi:hypothetical protein
MHASVYRVDVFEYFVSAPVSNKLHCRVARKA